MLMPSQIIKMDKRKGTRLIKFEYFLVALCLIIMRKVVEWNEFYILGIKKL